MYIRKQKRGLVFTNPLSLELLGTSGRTRTATPAKATDFESVMSTNFITLARGAGHYTYL